MATGSAFPVSEATRHIMDPGLTAHEFAAVAAMASLIAVDPVSDPVATAARAKAYAAALLSGRVSK